MKALLLLALLASSASAFAVGAFPENPDADLTPGSLCTKPDEFRYPERIPYCRRKVGSELKRSVIERYDADLGYQVSRMSRGQFKIDHYIPLCMGGSNSPDNLWPQHESIYKYTDPLEPVLCQKMAEGRLKQAQAVQLIRQAKADPEQAYRILGSAPNL